MALGPHLNPAPDRDRVRDQALVRGRILDQNPGRSRVRTRGQILVLTPVPALVQGVAADRESLDPASFPPRKQQRR